MLLNCNAGHEQELVDSIRQIPGVTEASVMVGPYDMMVRVSAETTSEAKNVVNWQIKRLEGVRTSTALIVKSNHFSRHALLK